MTKRVILALCAVLLILGAFVPALVSSAAESKEITVTVDGRTQKFTNSPILDGKTVMVDITAIAELFNADLVYENDTVTAKKGIYELVINTSKKEATLCGEAYILDAAPNNIGSALYIPLKSFAEAFEYKYFYDNAKMRAVVGTKEKDLWWYKIPTYADPPYEEGTEARVWSTAPGEFTWGAEQVTASAKNNSGKMMEAHMWGNKCVGYFEASGQLMCFYRGFISHPDDEGGLQGTADVSAWGTTDIALSQVRYWNYAGPAADVNEEPPSARYFTREGLGYTNINYPDGSSALGYLEDPELPYPVNAKIYDMACAKNLEGTIYVDYQTQWNGNVTDKGLCNVVVGTKTMRKFPGYSNGDTVTFLSPGLNKDPAAPFWLDQTRSSAKIMLEAGSDGAWFDNMSPWDNFSGMHNAFGDWSEYRFNLFLKENFTTEQLADLGIKNMDNFNIREYIMAIASDSGVDDPANYEHPFYKSSFWVDEPVYTLYKYFKSVVGREYLQDMYKIFKDEAKRVELTEGFAVYGNDMPALNHGWIEDDWVDITSAEMGHGWNLTFGSKGIGTPPVGKMAIFYRASLEQMSGNYSMPWLYAGEDWRGKTDSARVVLAEAFANGAIVKKADNTIGTERVHRWMNRFLHKSEEEFGFRYMHYDIGILYSSADQLANMVPHGVMGANNDKQLHMQGLWGFSHAMVDAHIPYRIIPEWRLNSQTISDLKTLILPNVECLDDGALEVLMQFVENGGHLVITGPAGIRYSFDGMILRRDSSLLSGLVGQDISNAPGIDFKEYSTENYDIVNNSIGNGTVTWVSNPIGFDYYIGKEYRDEIFSTILNVIGTTELFDGSSLPDDVGAFVWKSNDGEKLFVDLVNYNCDIIEDTVTAQNAISFKIKLPEGTDASKVTAKLISPDIEEYTADAAVTVENGWANVTLDDLYIYTSVKLSTGNEIVASESTNNSGSNNNDSSSDSDINWKTIALIAGAAVTAIAVVIVIIIVTKKKTKKA